jgi:hypothetical protein
VTLRNHCSLLSFIANDLETDNKFQTTCDIASPKVSLSQGREGEMEGKETPELMDYAYSCLMV